MNGYSVENQTESKYFVCFHPADTEPEGEITTGDADVCVPNVFTEGKYTAFLILQLFDSVIGHRFRVERRQD